MYTLGCKQTNFVFKISGPVAMNWIVATGDVYAAGRMIDFGVINMCADFVAKGKVSIGTVTLTLQGWG